MAIAKMTSYPTSYGDAFILWHDSKHFNGSVRLGHNTTLHELPNGDFAIKYYDTFIVTYTQEGQIILDTGGWDTVTTSGHMDVFTPDSISVKINKGKTEATLTAMYSDPFRIILRPKSRLIIGTGINGVIGGPRAELVRQSTTYWEQIQ